MKLHEILNVIDKNEMIQIKFTNLSLCEKMKNTSKSVLDMDVKSVKTEGCAMLFIEVGW